MAHTTPITRNQVRHVDEYDVLEEQKGEGNVYFNDLDSVSQARFVDEYRLAEEHESES